MMRGLPLAPTLAASCLLTGPAAASESDADFARDVPPIFARACLSCHGPQKQRGGLRLDTAAGLREGGDSGPPVVPGDSSKSRLYHAITGTNDVPVMPQKGPRLTAEEVGRVKAWIDQGAKLPAEEGDATRKAAHWAFQPVRRPGVPESRNPQSD